MESDIKRRDFLKQGLLLAGTAGVLASGLAPKAAFSQTQGNSVRRADRYEDSFIFERKPFKWPGNKTLAVWIVPNVEVWHYDSAGGNGHFSQRPKHRAGCDQLCLAGIWHASRFVAHRGYPRRRRSQSNGRIEFRRGGSPSEGRAKK